MKEQDEIDKFFKEQLYDRESQLDPNALIAAMGMLEQEDRESIAAKRKSRFMWMAVVGLAMLFALSVFLLNHSREDQVFSKISNEKTQVDQLQEIKTATSLTESEILNDSNDDKAIVGSTELQHTKPTSTTDLTNLIKKNEPVAVGQERKSTQRSIDNIQRRKDTPNAKTTSTSYTTEKRISSAVNETQKSIIQQDELITQVINDQTVYDNQNELNTNTDDTLEHVESDAVVEQNTSTPLVSQTTYEESTNTTSESDSLHTVVETLPALPDSVMAPSTSAAMIYPPTPNHKLVLFGGLSGYQISSAFRDSGNELGEYISQRNDQETAIQTWGADLGVMHMMRRSSLRLGLGFYASGENVQYQGMKTSTTYDTTTYWEHSNLWLQIIDATPIDGVYVFDTTYISVNADSSMHTEVITNTEITNNAEIQRNNGKTKMYHVTIPITYSFNVIQSQRINVALLGGMEADYRISNNARYLNPNRESTTALPSFDGYRKFMLNGTLGIELQYGSAMSKIGFTAGVGMKRNLYSWNKNFSHIYSSPSVRLGVVFRL